jgi:hypothetical protein
MEPWVKKYLPPVDYENWLKGKLHGYHPQDLKMNSPYLAAKRGEYNGN